MFKPFENGTESHAIHDLTLENQEDRVSIYGNLQLTKDQAGLQAAKALQAFVNAVVSALENETHLPEKIDRQDEQEIENPFL
ncbi:hypothetical protein H0920_12765 [Acinetobacter sp. C_4_1]|uniref:hypothetical protein n=1 Tax=unclassified Acinetobacter TaxID=196816 RepID=UPI0021B782C2|nr:MULTISPECIES: hypothetical protein [unclassified Acinetobacter]MCT8090324.1 hypothetical protein [Acinetobacter sp. F_3_1]MCT8097881.1 hypothetical protein [Acinetobacter sp. C_3_1]MCT8101948.1 hypothetical protein [Acinetobacter sp. C_4_1]MCT8135676.1 hypothetical protein [Acinetobacter sp. T_3_1]